MVKIIDTKEFIPSDMKGHYLFIGEILQAYADENYLTNGVPDISKMKPITLIQNDNYYWKVGEKIGRAWKIGKDYPVE